MIFPATLSPFCHLLFISFSHSWEIRVLGKSSSCKSSATHAIRRLSFFCRPAVMHWDSVNVSGQRGTSATLLRFPTAKRSLACAVGGTRARQLVVLLQWTRRSVRYLRQTRNRSSAPTRGGTHSPTRRVNLVAERRGSRPLYILYLPSYVFA